MKHHQSKALVSISIVILLLSIIIPSFTFADNQYYQQEIYKLKYKKCLSNYSKESEVAGSLPTIASDLSIFPWPMYCHYARHTGLSQFSTADNPSVEKWRLDLHGWVHGHPVIDNDGIIYVGSYDFYAIYPNGTIKWSYNTHQIESAAAIGDDGMIYVGSTSPSPSLYAFYPNGTVKWQFGTGDSIFSSPVIGSDGTIYFGQNHGIGGYINALYPNGTLRWRFQTGHMVYSSPALAEDDTIYCGSHDGNLYALYPNNGTLKWAYHTGDWVARGPAIADDGTIYCGSWDGYLYALYPIGTLRWKTGGYLAGTTPVIGADGTIYVGNEQLTAIYQENGSVKWSYDPGPERTIRGANPAISADGTIYFGTWIEDAAGGEIIAVNPDGTEKWRKLIATDWVNSAPAIGPDGTVYIGSTCEPSDGFLHAFGRGPIQAEANGPYNGYAYTPLQFIGTIYGGIPPYTYHWDFGDGFTSTEQNPTHNYSAVGNYTATFTVIDSEENISHDTAQVTVTYTLPSITIIKPEDALYILNIKTIPLSRPIIIGPITIKVDATQEPLGIDRVEFSIDGKLKATDTNAPYSWTWRMPSFSKHTITVTAYDTSGKSTARSIDVWKFF